MFKQVLYTQMKWTRLALAMMSVVAFAAPAGLWRAMHDSYFRTFTAMEVMGGFSALGFVLAVIAFFSGFIVVAQTWQVDTAARHVYPLSLPISWPHYVALRFGAGAVLLIGPAIAVWLGCLLVLALIQVPPTLNAYPTTLAFRFLLGSLVAYAVVFAVQYLSGKKAAYLLLGALLAFTALTFAAAMTGNEKMITEGLKWLFEFPGPLAVYGSEWMLIDV